MSDPSQPAKAEARTLTSTSSSTPLAIDPPPQKVDKIPEEAPMILDVSGESIPIKLDKLGPMIINSDGTISRIQNWHELSQIEQERTVRLLVKKRNLVRLKKLEQEDSSGGERLGALKDERT